MRPSMQQWVVALGLMVASAPALAQDLSYVPNVPQWLALNPFATMRTATGPRRTTPAAPAVALAPSTPRNVLDELIAAHARLNNVPEALIHRVVKRESRYNPRAIGQAGAMGLMQIKHATARALGYTGPPAGLLDPVTNLTYAVRYLAGALRAAHGDPERAYALYRSGYYTSERRAARAAERAQHRDAPARLDSATEGLRGSQ